MNKCIKCIKHHEIKFIIFLFLIISFIFTLPIFFNIRNLGIQDWDQHFFYHGVARKTILEYKQFPFWNPYYCGGTVLFAHPQSRILSPSYLFVLLFGEVIGLKFDILLHLFIGLLGTFILSRSFKLNKLESILCSFIYILGSMFTLNVAVGMTWFLSVSYLPYAFNYFLLSFKKIKYIFLCALFLVLMFFGGGAYPFSITFLFFFFYSFTLIIFKKERIIQGFKILSLIILLTFCLGAIKFLPSIEFLSKYPRKTDIYSGFSLFSFYNGLLSMDQSLDSSKNQPNWNENFINGVSFSMDENGMYIGIIPLILFFIGLIFHYKSKSILLVNCLIFLWLMFGDQIPISLWKIIRIFPLYDSLQISQRFKIIFLLLFSLFASFGLNTLRLYLNKNNNDYFKKTSNYLSIIILLIVMINYYYINIPILKKAFIISPYKNVQKQTFHQINSNLFKNFKGWFIPKESVSTFYDPWGTLYPNFISNIGVIDGYETMELPRFAIPYDSKNYKGEFYLKKSNGNIKMIKWSPNRLILKLDILNDDILVINQNYYKNWKVKSDKRKKTISIDGLLGVNVSKNDKYLELYYLPYSFIFGCFISLTTVFLYFYIYIKKNRVDS